MTTTTTSMHYCEPTSPFSGWRKTETRSRPLVAGLLVTILASSATAQPNVAIGSGSGAPGDTLPIQFELSQNGFEIVTIAPLQMQFDPDNLSLQSCTSQAPGKDITVAEPTPGLVSAVISGGLSTFSDGGFLECRFRIADQATSGDLTLAFVQAGMSDSDFNDVAATGSDGSIIVEGPTATPTNTSTAPPTPTETVAASPTNTPGVTAPPTPTMSTSKDCPGDCNGSGFVEINELILLVNISLGLVDIESCTSADTNENDAIAINELIAAVNRALSGCEP